MFTRQHYKAIANLLRQVKEDYRGGTPAELILMTLDGWLADYFKIDNPRFDRQKFLDACNLE